MSTEPAFMNTEAMPAPERALYDAIQVFEHASNRALCANAQRPGRTSPQFIDRCLADRRKAWEAVKAAAEGFSETRIAQLKKELRQEIDDHGVTRTACAEAVLQRDEAEARRKSEEAPTPPAGGAGG